MYPQEPFAWRHPLTTPAEDVMVSHCMMTRMLLRTEFDFFSVQMGNQLSVYPPIAHHSATQPNISEVFGLNSLVYTKHNV